MKTKRTKSAISGEISRRRISRSLATILAFTLLQVVLPSQNPAAYAAAGNVGPTTTSGTCAAAVGETTYVTATFENNTFCLLKFSTGTTWTVPTGVSAIDILVVGGGGGGGTDGGGGGGGGEVRQATGVSVTAGASGTVTVGLGGSGGSWSGGYGSSPGNTSSLVINGTTYSAGGGAGGVGWQSASNNALRGSGGTNGSAIAGGTNYSYGGTNSNQTPGYTTGFGAAGFDGVSTAFTGTTVLFAGGGGGGICTNTVSDPNFGGLAGGAGGGGRGSLHTQNVGSDAGQPGTNGLGGGGGAGAACNDGGTNGVNARTAGGRGGNGVVYIKYIPAISITSNPSSVTAVLGTTTTFTASNLGTISGATRTKKWQVLVPGGSWADIASSSADSYTTPTITRAMYNYQYRYVVSDSAGTLVSTSISSVATLTVIPPPQGDTDTAISKNGIYNYAYLREVGSEELKALSGDNYTFEAWVVPTSNCSTGNGYCTIAGREGDWLLAINNGELTFITYNVNTWGTWQATGTNIPLNQWSHVALTKNSTTWSLYVNGIKTYSATLSYSPLASSGYYFYVGERWGWGYTFNGSIDEVRLWRTDRGANIASDMTSTATNTTGLLAYWNFNEGSGYTAYNQVPGVTAVTDFILEVNNLWDADVVSTQTQSGPYTVRTFKRSILTLNGGWKVPTGVTRVSTLLVAGGGGGGGGLNGGGGGAGGFIETWTAVTPASYYPIYVGAGGVGAMTGNLATTAPSNGTNSSAFSLTAIGGGKGGAEYNSPYAHYASGSGGSGGGASWGNNSSNYTGSDGTAGQGNKGGNNLSNCCFGAGGGGAGAVGGNTTSTTAGAGGAGKYSVITGTTLAGGGGGSLRGGGNAAGTGGVGGDGGGGAGASSGSAKPNATGGPQSGSANTGGGGGAGVFQGATTDGKGAQGGTGVVVVRWITASKPIFTQPTSDTTTAGLIDTITVSADPISPLTRTYRWQSSSDTGTTWSNISTGSGFTSQTYSTPILETTTSGIRYQYRVIVTDSDTVGLSIVDTSSAVYIAINPRISISGTYTTQKYGATHTDTFTAVTGTGTGNKTFTFTPNNRAGITWNGATANQATLTLARTLGPGTYYETMTATDTKGATSQYAIAIVVGKADTITVTSLARTDTYTGSALSFTPGYTISGLQNSDTVTSISWSYSGTENSASSFGPSATKPVNAGSYQITPTAVITNSDSYTAVVYETSTLTINRATRTLTGSVSPSPLKFGATGNLSSTPSAGAGDGAVTYVSSTTDSCTVSAANLLALKSSGTCTFTARIARGNNYESATSTSVNVNLVKADTLTVSVNAITPLTYTGYPAAVSPTVTVSGLALTNAVGANPVTINYVGLGASGASCAQGGACAVGDTGPGGGKVFYVAPTQQSWGRYLEAAPANWSGGADNQASNTSKWCEATPSIDGTTYSGLWNGLGFGYSNTYDTRLNVCTGGAIYNARAYRGGGFTNWYVPNNTELALMADSSVRTMLGLVNDLAKWGYWGSYQSPDTGYIGSLVTANWAIGATVKSESGKNYLRPIRAFSDGEVAIATYSSPPTDAGTYTVKASSLALTSGTLTDYEGVTYTDGTLLINRAQQQPLVIAQYGATFGVPYKVMIFGGSGTGALTETVTAGTASGCSISGDTVTSTTVGACQVFATKAQDRNYETATANATIYFLLYVANQPAPAPSGGSAIGISGGTPITRDANTAPTISSLSTYTATAGTTQIVINGAGFNQADIASITVKFWRNVLASGFTINGGNSQITVTVPAGATTGKVMVITPNGIAVSELPLTITP